MKRECAGGACPQRAEWASAVTFYAAGDRREQVYEQPHRFCEEHKREVESLFSNPMKASEWVRAFERRKGIRVRRHSFKVGFVRLDELEKVRRTIDVTGPASPPAESA